MKITVITTRDFVLTCATILFAALAVVGCGGTADAVTATDLEQAASAVLGDLPPAIAELLTVEQVNAEGARACSVLADFDDRPAVGEVLATLLDETWSDPVETDVNPIALQDTFIGLVEGPYVISLAQHYCPDQAVRTNLI